MSDTQRVIKSISSRLNDPDLTVVLPTNKSSAFRNLAEARNYRIDTRKTKRKTRQTRRKHQ